MSEDLTWLDDGLRAYKSIGTSGTASEQPNLVCYSRNVADILEENQKTAPSTGLKNMKTSQTSFASSYRTRMLGY